jgi:hypothetical protein
MKKRVHFDKDGSGSLTLTIHIIHRSTPVEIRGDTSATIRSLETPDPDFGTMALLRTRRLRGFRRRVMIRRGESWRPMSHRFRYAFQRLKNNYRCQRCHCYVKGKLCLLVQNRMITDQNAWCAACREWRHREIFTKRIFLSLASAPINIIN